MRGLGSKLWGFIDRTAKVIVKGLFRFMKKELMDTQWESFMQFVKFGLVGLSNTVISYVVYAILVYFGVHYLVSSVVSFVVSVLNSYFWNNRFVFTVGEGEKRSGWKALFKTFVAYAFTGLLLNNILLVLWVDVLHMSEYIGPLLNLVISIPLNYLLNKFWAFKKTEDTGL